MFDASRKFNVEIRNVGTEPITIKAQEAVGAREARIRRVVGTAPPQLLQPGQSIMLIGYEPGVSHKIEPGLRSPDHPMGMLDAVPIEFGKPGVVERVQQGLPPMPWTGEPGIVEHAAAVAPEFEMCLEERRVLHRASGIWFTFPEYPSEETWKDSDSCAFRDAPGYAGDRRELGRLARRFAIANGMTAQRPKE